MELETHICATPPLGLNQNIPLMIPTPQIPFPVPQNQFLAPPPPQIPLLVPQNQVFGPPPTLQHQQFGPVFYPPSPIFGMNQLTVQQSYTAFPAPSINAVNPPQFSPPIYPIGIGMFPSNPIACPSLPVGIGGEVNNQIAVQMEPTQTHEQVGDQKPPTIGPVPPMQVYGPRTGVETDRLPVRQILGELTIGPPFYHRGPPPSPDAEIFVAHLPTTDESIQDKIYNVFSQIGAIYKIRMKMNFSGSNKGYCFVHYYSWRDAERAIEELDGYKFYETCFSGIILEKSRNSKRLVVFGIPKYLDPEHVFNIVNEKQQFSDLIDFFCPSIVAGNRTQHSKNRGFCFMEFKTHMSAMFARKFMLRCPGKIFEGFTVFANWANPRPEKGGNNGTSSSNPGEVQSNQS